MLPLYVLIIDLNTYEPVDTLKIFSFQNRNNKKINLENEHFYTNIYLHISIDIFCVLQLNASLL